MWAGLYGASFVPHCTGFNLSVRMMGDLNIEAISGDELLYVLEISKPFGTGGDVYHMMVNNYYKGRLTKRDGKWIALENTLNLTSDDISVLGDLIDEEELRMGKQTKTP